METKNTLALWKYLKEKWADKKGGELLNQKKWRIIGNRFALQKERIILK